MIDVGNNTNFIGLEPEMRESEPVREVARVGGTYIPPSIEAPRPQQAIRIL